jgi:uncharacterized protein YecE (DUF72 family)
VARERIFVGTSGFFYKHWIGRFYPAGMKKSGYLKYYARFLESVELNSPFYRLPPKSSFRLWASQVPGKFVFAVKASRYVTHVKKLNVPKSSLTLFLGRARGLGKKLGPILYQLPPKWNLNLERFERFLKLLPRGLTHVFEFRNASWLVPETYALMKKFGAAFCIYELAGFRAPAEVTSDAVYVRLHGPTAEKYKDSYSEAALAAWARRARAWAKEKKTVYFYFDNDEAAYAVKNARTLREMLR